MTVATVIFIIISCTRSAYTSCCFLVHAFARITSAVSSSIKVSSAFQSLTRLHLPNTHVTRYPVDILYTKAPESDYLDAVVVTVLQVRSHAERDTLRPARR